MELPFIFCVYSLIWQQVDIKLSCYFFILFMKVVNAKDRTAEKNPQAGNSETYNHFLCNDYTIKFSQNQCVALYIINSAGIAYHQLRKKLYIIIAKA